MDDGLEVCVPRLLLAACWSRKMVWLTGLGGRREVQEREMFFGIEGAKRCPSGQSAGWWK
jgi:hypothetical protein